MLASLIHPSASVFQNYPKPETKHLKIGHPKKAISCPNHHFAVAMIGSGGGYISGISCRDLAHECTWMDLLNPDNVAQPLHDMGTEDIFPQQSLDNIVRPYRPQQLGTSKFKVLHEHSEHPQHQLKCSIDSIATSSTSWNSSKNKICTHGNTWKHISKFVRNDWEIAMHTVYRLRMRVGHICNQSGRICQYQTCSHRSHSEY